MFVVRFHNHTTLVPHSGVSRKLFQALTTTDRVLNLQEFVCLADTSLAKVCSYTRHTRQSWKGTPRKVSVNVALQAKQTCGIDADL